MIDLRCDAHIHTAFSAGSDSVSVLVGAAEEAGLSSVTFADRAGPESGWLPSYLAAIHRAQQRTDVVLRTGIEVEPVGADGWVAFPPDLGGLEVISIGLSRLPLPGGLVGPEAVRSLVAAGNLAATTVVEQFCTVCCRAIERVSRYAPTCLARPLNFLSRAGIAESAIGEDAVAALVETCRAHRTTLEISEWYRVPSSRFATVFLAAGVPLAAASDARQPSEIGRWEYVRHVAEQLGAMTGESRCLFPPGRPGGSP